MLALVVPVVLAELGWVTMGIVDTLIVGRLGVEAIGAVGLGSSIFMAVGVFAMGLLLGLDTLVSQSFGAGRLDECHRWLLHGVALSLALTVPITGLMLALSAGLAWWGLDPAVLPLARAYFDVVTWSLLPLLLYAAFRRYLQATGSVRPVMMALVLANVVNVFFNWVLVFGHLGAPALGVAGSAWATVVSRAFMAGWLLWAIGAREVRRGQILFLAKTGDSVTRFCKKQDLTLSSAWMKRLVALGLPAAMQITLEFGVFAMATALAGWLAPVALASHQIAVNVASVTFMVPYGISSAGAVRVGQAIGRGDGRAAARAGWMALFLGTSFMTCAAVVFVTLGRQIISAFTSDPLVLNVGATLLAIAAVFQLFDGLQGVATGVLRGAGDTRTPMLWNLAGHWFVGLPLGYALCFSAGLGIIGLWWGLSVGLIICGAALLVVWHRRSRALV
jgi:MATE family multidrug resistance protein